MAQELRGSLKGKGLHIAIVVARFNEFVTLRLLEEAREGLRRHGVRDEDTAVVWVPGSFELPIVAKALASTGRWNAVICLGAVIRGETAHFEHVATQAAVGIAAVARETGVPVIFGVLATYTVEQAIDRTGGKAGNTGAEAASDAVEMVNLLRALRELEA